MSRPLRIEYPGAVYHVTGRGNERKRIYREDSDRCSFLQILHEVNERYNVLCHSYCLMDNHYHLLLETPDGNLSIGMRHLNGVYTQRFNKRHERRGHLFQGRYKALLIQKDSHLLEVCRYVVLNPLRAGIVSCPGDWKWSSYRATAGLEKPHPCLMEDWILAQFGSTRTHGDARKTYRRFVNEGILRDSLWQDVKAQSILGGDEFVQDFVEYAKGSREISAIPRIQRFMGRPSLAGIFTGDVLKDKKERNKAIIKAVEEHGYRQREIADHLGMYFSSISRIVRGMTKKQT